MKLNLVIAFCLLIHFVGDCQNDTINQRDENNRKQGHWVYYGKDRPEEGYPADGKIEEGRYVNDRKEGFWLKYHVDGKTIKLKGYYENNRPNGEYFKYYPSGQLKESGVFKKNQYNTERCRYYESGQLKSIEKYTIEGKANDTSFFYFETGCLDYVDIYSSNGVYQKTFVYSRDSCNLVTDTSRHIGTHCMWATDIEFKYESSTNTEITPVNPSVKVVDPEVYKGEAPWLEKPRTKGDNFTPNGYNKVYNENDEICQDGDFRNGRLWDGKVYYYDDDGILLKVKVFKKGFYHSDASYR